jgi:hypothetical protein
VNIGAPNTTIHVTSGADPQTTAELGEMVVRGDKLDEISAATGLSISSLWHRRLRPRSAAATVAGPRAHLAAAAPADRRCSSEKADLLFAQLFHASAKAGLFL